MKSERNMFICRFTARGKKKERGLNSNSLNHRRESGAFAIMFIPLLVVMCIMCGLALNAGQLYNRKADLSGFAKAVALAAARELNGTEDGLNQAKSKARETAEGLKYQYFESGTSFVWQDAALSFSNTPAHDGTWIPASGAGAAQATSLYFVKVDTAGLASSVRSMNFIFPTFGQTSNEAQVRDIAIAGKTSLNVTPLAICAMSPVAASKNTYTSSAGTTLSELVQYGFRRGVSYDLMQLNPNETTAASYVINPVVAPGASGPAFDTSILGPFMCSGSMWVPRITGGFVQVSRLPSTAPLASLHIPLNSRFDIYGGGPCAATGAPPDYNVKAYEYDKEGSVKWMSPTVGARAALTVTSNGKRQTAADLLTPAESPGNYGPLWAFTKAAKAPSSLDAPEPSGGYTTFSTADWPTLYKSGPTAPGYPTATASPYLSTSTTSGNYVAPKNDNLEISTLQRRVLNIPLLSCSPSTPSGTNVNATVIAIGKFFMTVPATQDSLIGEFAGLVPAQSISGQVELYP
jgi:hypothetical protein